jgi:hypothetical protein
MVVLGMQAGGWATQILPQTSDDLAQKADLIFVGTCLTRTVKEGPPVHTEYTFKIETPVKGTLQPGETFTVRQWGNLPGAAASTGIAGPRLLGMPSYEPGQSYMLFLGPQSQSGFRAPVGLGQGVFHVTKAADGSTVVQNEMGNRFLFPSNTAPVVKPGKAVQPPASTVGPLRLNDFIQTIRKSGGPP